MTFIVGLAGPGRVGKSTTAKRIVETFNTIYPLVKINRYAFAQPIYEVASTLTGLSIDILKDEHYKETIWTEETAPIPSLVNWSPRKFLQSIGTECFRNNVSQSFWIETALKKVSHLHIAIIEDARFNNEFEKCDVVIELSRVGVEYAKNHPSAMPPDDKYIGKRISLYDGMLYNEVVDYIAHLNF